MSMQKVAEIIGEKQLQSYIDRINSDQRKIYEELLLQQQQSSTAAASGDDNNNNHSNGRRSNISSSMSMGNGVTTVATSLIPGDAVIGRYANHSFLY